jgi:hypothetical protein
MSEPAGECAIVSDGTNLFIEFKGKRIAQRGHPGTRQAKTWVSLEPGWQVFDDGRRGLTITYDRRSTVQ